MNMRDIRTFELFSFLSSSLSLISASSAAIVIHCCNRSIRAQLQSLRPCKISVSPLFKLGLDLFFTRIHADMMCLVRVSVSPVIVGV